jgi:CheY-like chemotaxis protein
MKNSLRCIMLVDDNPFDNFFHERQIKRCNPDTVVIAKTSGYDALEYLNSLVLVESVGPDLIFLDINMPKMNGWEFLVEYEKLEEDVKSKYVIIMLTTSENPEDIAKSKEFKSISDFISKPLTKELMNEITKHYFI